MSLHWPVRGCIVEKVAQGDERLAPAADPPPLLGPICHGEDGVVLTRTTEKQAEPGEQVDIVEVLMGGGRQRQGSAVGGAHPEGPAEEVLGYGFLLLWAEVGRWVFLEEYPVELFFGGLGAEVAAQNVLQEEWPVPPQDVPLLRLQHGPKLGLHLGVVLVHLEERSQVAGEDLAVHGGRATPALG